MYCCSGIIIHELGATINIASLTSQQKKVYNLLMKSEDEQTISEKLNITLPIVRRHTRLLINGGLINKKSDKSETLPSLFGSVDFSDDEIQQIVSKLGTNDQEHLLVAAIGIQFAKLAKSRNEALKVIDSIVDVIYPIR